MPKPTEIIQGFVVTIAFGLGICHIVLGCLAIGIEMAIVATRCWGWMLGIGFWVGGMILVTGFIAVAMRWNKEPRGLSHALLVMSIVCFVMALFLVIFGWVAATQEYYSFYCNQNLDYVCADETARMSIDISMMVLGLLEMEVCIMSGVLAYIMLEAPAIGPFNSITGLPIGKEKERKISRPGKESTTTSSYAAYGGR